MYIHDSRGITQLIAQCTANSSSLEKSLHHAFAWIGHHQLKKQSAPFDHALYKGQIRKGKFAGKFYSAKSNCIFNGCQYD